MISLTRQNELVAAAYDRTLIEMVRSEVVPAASFWHRYKTPMQIKRCPVTLAVNMAIIGVESTFGTSYAKDTKGEFGKYCGRQKADLEGHPGSGIGLYQLEKTGAIRQYLLDHPELSSVYSEEDLEKLCLYNPIWNIRVGSSYVESLWHRNGDISTVSELYFIYSTGESSSIPVNYHEFSRIEQFDFLMDLYDKRPL